MDSRARASVPSEACCFPGATAPRSLNIPFGLARLDACVDSEWGFWPKDLTGRDMLCRTNHDIDSPCHVALLRLCYLGFRWAM